MLLKERGISADEIELIIIATVTADMNYPSTACIVQHAIGANNCWGFDLSGACSGFLFALNTGAQFIKSGQHKKVVVIGADKMSSITDYSSRDTCVLFGDAAGALLLEATTEEMGVMDAILRTDGSGKEFLHMKAGGSVKPPSHDTINAREHFIYQEWQMLPVRSWRKTT